MVRMEKWKVLMFACLLWLWCAAKTAMVPISLWPKFEKGFPDPGGHSDDACLQRAQAVCSCNRGVRLFDLKT